jgi:hypothetical protein
VGQEIYVNQKKENKREMVKRDLTGQIFNRLTVLKSSENKNGKTTWLCKCDCGNECKVYTICLTKGFIPPCKSHGMTESKEYKAWCLMKSRCYVVHNNQYLRYGGRGIKVCDRWLHSFENFYADMGNKPTSKHTLDRKNSNEDYSPNNCRWATQKEQQGNRTNNRWHEYNGIKMILADWATYFGVTDSLIRMRMKRGSSFEKIYLELNKAV